MLTRPVSSDRPWGGSGFFACGVLLREPPGSAKFVGGARDVGAGPASWRAADLIVDGVNGQRAWRHGIFRKRASKKLHGYGTLLSDDYPFK